MLAQRAPGFLDLDHLDKADAVMETQALSLVTLKQNRYETRARASMGAKRTSNTANASDHSTPDAITVTW